MLKVELIRFTSQDVVTASADLSGAAGSNPPQQQLRCDCPQNGRGCHGTGREHYMLGPGNRTSFCYGVNGTGSHTCGRR